VSGFGEEYGAPPWAGALFAHVLVILPAFTLSQGLDLPFVTLLFAFQVLVYCSELVYPRAIPYVEEEESKPRKTSGQSSAPQVSDPAQEEDKRAALRKRYTTRFENWKAHDSVDHITKILGYPMGLLSWKDENQKGPLKLPAHDSCGAGCPFLAARFGEFTGKTVVEFGSGTGQDAFICSHLGAKQVIGLDLTPAAIKVSTSHTKSLGLSSSVKFQLQAIDTDFDASLKGIADIVLSNGVINLCSNKLKVFQNAYAVLKSKGVFLFADVLSMKPVNMDTIT